MRLKALTAYVYPSHCINFNAALTVHNFHSLGSIPCLKLPKTYCHNGTGKFKHNIFRILPRPHLYTWVKSSNADKLPCWRTKVHGDGGLRTRALCVRIEWILQHTCTTTPRHSINNNNNNSVYLLSTHSIRFAAHGANYYYPGYARPSQRRTRQTRKILPVPIYYTWVERDNCG